MDPTTRRTTLALYCGITRAQREAIERGGTAFDKIRHAHDGRPAPRAGLTAANDVVVNLGGTGELEVTPSTVRSWSTAPLFCDISTLCSPG